jgi:hypothetical protein
VRSVHSQQLLHRPGLAEGDDYEKAVYTMAVVVAMKETMQETSELATQELDMKGCREVYANNETQDKFDEIKEEVSFVCVWKFR